MIKDSFPSIRKSAARFLSGTLLSRVAGMVRDMSMAYAFGTEPSIAAFMLAFRLSHLLRRVFGEGGLQSVFTPEFEHLRQQGEKQAFRFFWDLNLSLFAFLSLLIIGGCSALFWFSQQGWISDSNREVLTLTFLMLPSLLFICLYGLYAALLQCQRVYFLPSVAPVGFNILWIVAILSISHFPAQEAMVYLSIAVILACLAQWAVIVPSCWRTLSLSLGPSFWKKGSFFSKEVIKLIKPFCLGLVGIAASQINNALDALFARFAEIEGPAFLWYAIRLQQLPLALFGVAIAGALLPPLSRAIKSDDSQSYHHFLRESLKQTMTLMIPLTALLFIMGDTIVNLIYGHGDFAQHSIASTTRCLWAYGSGLIPTALILVLAPAFYAKSHYHTPAYAAVLSMLLNLALNTWFILGEGLGAVSVAMATSLSAWVNMLYLGRSLWTLDPTTPLLKDLPYFLKASLATLVASFCTLGVRASIGDNALFFMLQKQEAFFPTTLKIQFLFFTLEAAIFAASWILCSLSLRLFFLPERLKKLWKWA